MVICSEYNLITKKVMTEMLQCGKKVMTEMLQCANDGQQLATRSAIIALGRIHNSRKERNGSLYAINFLKENSSHSNVRSIRVQNTRLLSECEGQGRCLNQGLLQGIERLLRFFRPLKSSHLTGEAGEWLGNGGEPVHKPAIIGQAKKPPNVPKAVGHWPIPNRLQLIPKWVNTLCTHYVAKELYFRLNNSHFEGLDFKPTSRRRSRTILNRSNSSRGERAKTTISSK